MSAASNEDEPLAPGSTGPNDGVYVHVAGDTSNVTLPPSVASRRDQIFPMLKSAEIDRLRRFGTVQTWQPGELMIEAGKPGPGMLVLLSGRVLYTRRNGMGEEEPMVERVPGEFLAEIGQLSDRPALADARAVGAVAALVIDTASLRALLVAEAALGERIMRALILRRMALIETGTGGPMLIGAPGGRRMLRLLGFLSRNGHPYTMLDPALDRAAEKIMQLHSPLPAELPLVLCPDGTVLKGPTERELARRLGLLPEFQADHIYDVAIIGAGPGGMATAVYAAADGLSVLVLETRAIGGQAGQSSRIENYLGFPTGISGPALAGRAFVQAQKFGAEVAVPVAATRLECARSPLVLDIDCGTRVSARTAVIATGAKYRRPAIPEIDRYKGRGVYYWASPIEARLCRREEVVLVGGGNSAGQAAVFLAGHATRVHVVIRGPGLAQSMSNYLVERIAAQANITLHAETEIVALVGDDQGLTGVRWRNRRNGSEETKAVRRVFLFVGADPNTGWLADSGVKMDDKGFVYTGTDLPPEEFARSPRPTRDRRPLPLETTISGVFAVGDARAGSTKRVASAVGEGAAVVAQVHAWLAAQE